MKVEGDSLVKCCARKISTMLWPLGVSTIREDFNDQISVARPGDRSDTPRMRALTLENPALDGPKSGEHHGRDHPHWLDTDCRRRCEADRRALSHRNGTACLDAGARLAGRQARSAPLIANRQGAGLVGQSNISCAGNDSATAWVRGCARSFTAKFQSDNFVGGVGTALITTFQLQPMNLADDRVARLSDCLRDLTCRKPSVPEVFQKPY